VRQGGQAAIAGMTQGAISGDAGDGPIGRDFQDSGAEHVRNVHIRSIGRQTMHVCLHDRGDDSINRDLLDALSVRDEQVANAVGGQSLA